MRAASAQENLGLLVGIGAPSTPTARRRQPENNGTRAQKQQAHNREQVKQLIENSEELPFVRGHTGPHPPIYHRT